MMVRIDGAKCSGHGRCYTVAPEVYESDEVGFALMRDQSFGIDERDKQFARDGAASCPEGAISVMSGDTD